MKYRWLVPVSVAALLSAACSSAATGGGSNWSPGESVVIDVGATNPTSSSYAISVGHKDLIEKAVGGVSYRLTGTQGGPEGIALLESGQVQVAVANNAAAYPAFAGDGADTVRSLFPLYSVEMAPVVLESNTSAQRFDDLLGGSIATGPVGSALEVGLREVLGPLGHSESDFRTVLKAAPEDGISALIADRVDAAWIGTAHPASQLMELRASRDDMGFVGFTDEEIAKIAEEYPYYFPSEIPAETYKTNEDVAALGSTAGLFVTADLSDELVYQMVKAMWEGRESLADVHPSQAKLDKELVRRQGESVPYHPGAQRYFEEIGVLSSASN